MMTARSQKKRVNSGISVRNSVRTPNSNSTVWANQKNDTKHDAIQKLRELHLDFVTRVH